MWMFLLTRLPGLAGSLLSWLDKRADRELQGFQAGAAIDRDARRDYLAAVVDNNRTKLAANGWWGARAITLVAGLPASAHMAAVFLDTLVPPFGSWGIPALPSPYDGYERDIVLSFFIVMPAMPVVGALATWLGRKR
jgi:hypothetical protein